LDQSEENPVRFFFRLIFYGVSSCGCFSSDKFFSFRDDDWSAGNIYQQENIKKNIVFIPCNWDSGKA